MGGSGRPPTPPPPPGGREARPAASARIVTTAKISVRGLHHEYVNAYTRERVVALDGIDLDVAEGELLAVVGPSGCGKSTLLSIVAGLIAPTRGDVLLDGRAVKGPGPDRGVVFQEFAI